MIGRLAGALLFTLAVVLDSTITAEAADPIRVESLMYEGSGCPAGSAAMNISPDGAAFTLLFDSFNLEIEPGPPKKQRTRECAVGALLRAPLGWSWAIVGVDFRGYVSLQSGVSATVESSFRFNRQRADERQAPPLETHLVGPIDRDCTLHADTPPLQIDWSKCGGRADFTSRRVEGKAPGAGGLESDTGLSGRSGGLSLMARPPAGIDWCGADVTSHPFCVRGRVARIAHWMISYACKSSDDGIVRPKIFAVLRLSTTTNVTGYWKGRSPGLASQRIEAAPEHPCRDFCCPQHVPFRVFA